ncbi:serine/threonine-protein kinase [Nocardiopsis prasina]|uniref:serine/threonine-protein kinase n=1 Tax=Nocardiopsis prasina TaxID=2015 RepID=UPI000346AE08|nr:serine/threonine-protein kinase [Nocardiopsis prasina]
MGRRATVSAVRPLSAHDPARLGPHRLVGRLGAGGMGTVYLARPWIGPPVAVKAVHPELADEPEFRSRFAREVDALSRVRSPFVPRFAGAAPHAEVPWLATAYVDGPTLKEQVERGGPLRGGPLTGLAAGMAAALADIHAAGVIHRDLKPSNVILSPDGPRVLDFGIAGTLDGAALPGGVMGTPGWIAPERFRGGPATAASDVFSWGQLTAYGATGRNPFGRGNPEAVVRRVMRGEADLNGVPLELASLVHASLSPLPGYRPAPHEILGVLGNGRGVPDTGVVATRIVREEWSSAVVSGASRHRRLLRRGAAVLAVATVVTAGAVVGVRHGGTGETPDRIGMSGVNEGGARQGDVTDRTGRWPPPEATETAVNAGRRNEVGTERRGGGSTAQEVRAEFTMGAPGRDGATIRVSAPERSPDGTLVFQGEFHGAQDPAYAYGFAKDQFAVLTEEGEYSPGHFPLEEADDAGVRFSVGFDGAPDTGLLVVRENGYVKDVDGAPPVGVCYSVTDAEFSVDYTQCT